MYLVVFFALIIGFIIGVAFGVWKISSLPQSINNSSQLAQPHPQKPETMGSAIIEALEKETKNNPDNFEVWKNLGNTYFDADQYKKSIHAYETALSLNPGDANVWTDLGVMYRRDNQPEKAIQSFGKAISVDSKHEVSRFNKGVVFMHDLNTPDEAIKAWEDLLKVNPVALAPEGHSVDELVQSLKSRK